MMVVAVGVLTLWAALGAGAAARSLRLPRRPEPPTGGAVLARPPAIRAEGAPRAVRASGAGLELPEVVESLAGAVAAGRPLGAGIEEVAGAAAEPLASELRSLARLLGGGIRVDDAVEQWAAGSAAPGAGLVAAAVGLARSAGAELDRALGGVAATLRERRCLDREVRALSAQARLSASVLAAAPVGVLVFGAVLDADLVAFLVGRPAGRACLVAGLVCNLVGWRWMRAIAASVGAGEGVRPGARIGREPHPAATLPEVVDLLAVAAAAGLPVAGALAAATPRCPEPWRAGLEQAAADARRGALLVDALAGLHHRLGPAASPLGGVLVDALADGDQLAPGLARLAADARDRRRRSAEERARRVPVRMLAPLVCCSLPAFVLIGLVPLMAGAMAGLAGPGSFPRP